MAPDAVMYAIVGIGAGSTAIFLILALVRGRQAPVRLWPWILGLVFAGVPAALLTLVAVAAAFSDGGGWLAVGVLGLWLLLGVSIVRPRWGAWCFIGSGLLLPVFLWGGDLLVADEAHLQLGVEQGTAMYTVRALITGGILIWATQPRRPHRA